MTFSLAPAEPAIGGYFPYVALPCERHIGETVKWITVLGVSGPTLCSLIPWLCCPIPFEFNSTDTISSDIACEDLGAFYGASIFWTMQAVSVYGLIAALISLASCLTTEEIVFDFGKHEPTLQERIRELLAIKLNEKEFSNVVRQDKEVPLNNTVDTSLTNVRLKINRENVDRITLNNSTITMSDITKEETKRRRPGKGRRKRNSVGNLHSIIPTQPPLYGGPDDSPPDACERDEILHVDGECYQILSQGPCEETEIVIMDEDSRKGICAPRLCAPDRVFVFEDQMCHDPLERHICPPGRELTSSSYGTPLCTCPDGSYEEEHDEDEDVCKPILAREDLCSAGQVFWFRNFDSEPGCFADPCKGLNLKKSKDEMPYVPSLFDGKCYQLGKELPQCPSDTFYSLSYHHLRGVCISLEDAGYLEVDEEQLGFLAKLYSGRLPRDSSRLRVPIGASVVPPSRGLRPIQVGEAVMSAKKIFNKPPPSRNPPYFPLFAIHSTHLSAFSPTSIRINSSRALWDLFKSFTFAPIRDVDEEGEEAEDDENEREVEEEGERRGRGRAGRSRRAALAFASPSNVFEPALSSCKAGARRGANLKCRQVILPARVPHFRPRRSTPPVAPNPSCRSGRYNIQRRCVSNRRKPQNNLLSQGLG